MNNGAPDVASRQVMRFDAFVSYSRSDERFVKPVVQFLSFGGRHIFWDAAIAPGEQWATTIKDALHQSAAIIVLWCCHAARSEWVSQETEVALNDGKPVLPVLLCSLPVREPLSKYQWIDYRTSITHECLRHPPDQGEPGTALDVVRLLSRGVGLQSLDHAEVARVWNRTLQPRSAGVSRYPAWMVLGITLLVFAFVRPFPTLVGDRTTLLINLLVALVGAAFVIGAARPLRRRRSIGNATYDVQLLALTIESIVRLSERGELGEFRARSRGINC